VFVSAQVVNPELLCPRFLGRWEDVGLDALGIEEAGRQAQQSMNIGLLEYLASYGFSGAAFEEDVVGNNDRGATVLQDREDMLNLSCTSLLPARSTGRLNTTRSSRVPQPPIQSS
jgi:hypothetical protein